MTERTRRHVLAAAGVAATGVLAGCSNSSAEEPEDAEDPSGTILGDITVENSHDDSHTVDVLVKFEGEIEHWSTHRLEADAGVDVERGWPGDPGDFRVIARLDEDELMEVGPADWNNLPCLNLVIRVSKAGELEIMTGAGGGKCGGESAGSDGESAGSDGSGDGGD